MKKISIFRWILIGLGVMLLLSYFIWPFLTFDKKTFRSGFEGLLFSDDSDHYKVGEKEYLGSENNYFDGSDHRTEESDLGTSDDIWNDAVQIFPSFWSGLQYSVFCVKLDGLLSKKDGELGLIHGIGLVNQEITQAEWLMDGDLCHLRDYRVMIAMMLIPCVLGIALIIVCVLTKRPGYIVGIVTGGVTFFIFLFFSIRVFHFSSARQTLKSYLSIMSSSTRNGIGTSVVYSRFLSAVHFNTLYILVLVIPVAVLALSILGLILDKKEEDRAIPDPTPGLDLRIPKRIFYYYFVGIQGSVSGQEFGIPDKGIMIGRSRWDCRIVINDSRISKVHCQVGYSQQHDAYFVRDISTNGIYKENRERLPRNQIIVLRVGDKIFLPSGDGFRFERYPQTYY